MPSPSEFNAHEVYPGLFVGDVSLIPTEGGVGREGKGGGIRRKRKWGIDSKRSKDEGDLLASEFNSH